MKEVWILCGRAGCYDSSHEWDVAAFEVEEHALVLMARIEREMAEYGLHLISDYRADRERLIAHFTEMEFPVGVFPQYGDLEDIRFHVYRLPFITAKPFNLGAS